MKERQHIANVYTRFFQKVNHHNFNPKKCWEWTGANKGNGYGSLAFGRTTIPAHRFSYELFRGEVNDGMDICHTCDNRICVNPDHLFQGTRGENMQDAKIKGRLANVCKQHLTKDQLKVIIERLNDGHPPRQISNDMEINYRTVTAIRAGRSYAKEMKEYERIGK